MPASYYENQKTLSEYLLFHYGKLEQILPYPFGPREHLDFPARCVSECLDISRLPSKARALDLGCAVGRSSFELSRYCESVIGIDASKKFIKAAREIQRHGFIRFERVEEGSLTTSCKVKLPTKVHANRVSFQIGDALNLQVALKQLPLSRARKNGNDTNMFRKFDVVLLANLIDRLRDPQKCLAQLPKYVKAGGQLIITSPYTWLEEFTPRKNWLCCGVARNKKRITTLDSLKKILQRDFQLLRTKDLPFVIREHARKFQWSVAQASVWIKQ